MIGTIDASASLNAVRCEFPAHFQLQNIPAVNGKRLMRLWKGLFLSLPITLDVTFRGFHVSRCESSSALKETCEPQMVDLYYNVL